MKLANATDDQRAVIARGKPTAPTRFSLAFKADPEKAERLARTYSTIRNPVARLATLLNQETPHQFLAPARVDGVPTAFLLTRAQLDPSDDTVVLGSLSDDLHQVTPVAISLPHFTSSYTSLFRAQGVAAEALVTFADAPDGLDGPPVDGNRVEGSMERLNWPHGDADTDIPVLAAHSTFFPVAPGLHLPASFNILEHTFPDEAIWQPVKVWQQGLQYAVSTNAGRSVTRGGPLFDVAGFPDDIFQGHNVLDDILQAEGPAFRSITPLADARAYNLVQSSIQALTNGVHYCIGATIPGAAAGNSTGLSTPIIVKADVPEVTTRADKEQAAHAKSIGTSWSATCASIDPTSNTIVVGTLAAGFLDCLTKSNKTTAIRALRDLVETISKTASAADTRYATMITLKKDDVTSGMVTTIRNFQVNTEMPHYALGTFKEAFSSAIFLPEDMLSLTIKQVCIDEVNNLFNTEYATASAKDQTKGSLYFGRLDSVTDVVRMGVNFIAFMQGAVVDFNASLCYAECKSFIDLLLSPQVRRWLDTFEASNPAIRYNLMSDFVHLVGSFLKVGSNSGHVRALNNQEPLSGDVFKHALLTSKQVSTRLLEAVNSGRVGTYGDQPTALMEFLGYQSKRKQDSTVSEQPAKKHSPNSKRAATPSTPSSSPRPGPSPAPRSAHPDDAKGILICTKVPKPRMPPFTNVRVKKTPTSQAEQLCPFFMTRGYHCTRKDCKRIHVPNLQALAEAPREKLIAHVAKDSSPYEWAPGQGPTSG